MNNHCFKKVLLKFTFANLKEAKVGFFKSMLLSVLKYLFSISLDLFPLPICCCI